MKKVLAILFVFGVFFFPSFSYAQLKLNLNSLNWLCGKWMIQSENENSIEEWKMVNDSLLIGKNFSIVNKDTVLNEYISIISSDDGVYYKAEVINQNNGNAVYFKLIQSSKNEVAFENKEHDFPKIIRYKYITKSKITASIEGKGKIFEFIMNKIK